MRSRGTDLAMFQGDAPFHDLAMAGVEFAMAKATEGTGYKDPKWVANLAAMPHFMRAAGCYGVLRAGRIPEQAASLAAEWEKLANACASTGARVLPPGIDFEIADKQGPRQLVDNCIAMRREIQRLTGEKPILYSYPSFLKQQCGDPSDDELVDLGQWLAFYPGINAAKAQTYDPIAALAKINMLPKLWARTGWAILQYDGNGGERMTNGVDADFDIANGTLEDLLRALYRDTLPAPSLDDGPPSVPTVPGTPPAIRRSSQRIAAVNKPIIDNGAPVTPIRAGEGEKTYDPEPPEAA